MIERKEIFIYKGDTYDALKQVKASIDNELGEIIDKLTNEGSFTPKQRILLFNNIMDNRLNLTLILDEVSDYIQLFNKRSNL